ncbi:hypothetical protein MTR_5g060360 [Medicago truncatula]|uniref:Uncharacterized protein n=1 Tax=Medicago truncatula TaxID=3880 RepID=G7K9W1_MEDTR|nr:hypothetical protein MTR_5g060360 [Medicago truncatula]
MKLREGDDIGESIYIVCYDMVGEYICCCELLGVTVTALEEGDVVKDKVSVFTGQSGGCRRKSLCGSIKGSPN